MLLDPVLRKLGELRRGGRELFPARLVVLCDRLGFESLFARPVARVAAQHPEAKAGDTQRCDQECQAHPQPRGHPLADEEEHDANYPETVGGRRR